MLLAISGNLASGKAEVMRYLAFQGFQLISFQAGGLDAGGLEAAGSPGSEFITLELANDSLKNQPLEIHGPRAAREHPETKTRHQASNDQDGGKSTAQIDEYSPAVDSWHFASFGQLLDTVTSHWRSHFVMQVDSMAVLAALQKRPFFLHVSIDAPLKLRYHRHCLKHSGREMGWDEFVARSDDMLYNAQNPLIEINNQSHVKIINTTTSIKSLYVKLSELDLVDPARLRPTWDSYFMRLADLAALRSNCMKRRVGCVLVKSNRVMATGYNGTPRNLTNCNEGGCPRCNQGQGSGAALSTCLCLHAEENALLEAGRDRILGHLSILYCNTCPCLTCSIKIVQSGIREVVYAQSYSMDELSHKVMCEAGITLRQYVPPKDGVFV